MTTGKRSKGTMSSLTVRAVILGVIIGVSVSVSNIYFGLQIGWSSSMSNQSALLGFAAFKMVSSHLKLPFTPQENVVVQTVAGAVGCMPVTAGFTGVIPAIEYLIVPAEQGPIPLSYLELLLWSLGVCLIGLIWAMMFREQIVVREQLPWPGPVATAAMISVLHENEKGNSGFAPGQVDGCSDEIDEIDGVTFVASGRLADATLPSTPSKIKALITAGIGSGIFTLLTYFVPIIRDVPLFGSYLHDKWLWSVNLSVGFVGSGIITGPTIPLHMLAGAIVGWAVLSPIAKMRGWAPGDVGDWDNGSRGWIMWVSLAALLSDCLTKLSWLVIKPMVTSRAAQSFAASCFPWFSRSKPDHKYAPLPPALRERQEAANEEETYRGSSETLSASPELTFKIDETESAPRSVGPGLLWVLLSFSVLVCTVFVHYVFGNMISTITTLVAIVVSLPLSIMGMRAIAETDWNPMSGIGKISQLVFALIVPRSNKYNVVINLIAGGLAEAGASQAGDIGSDLKIGHLLGGRPEDQFYGQIIGSVIGSFIGCALYRLYTSVYEIPGKLFPIPISHIFLLAARLVTGSGLPDHVPAFATCFAIFFVIGTVIKIRYEDHWWQDFIPGGVAFGVGMYNAPSFTLARAVGGVISWYCARYMKADREHMVVLAGGLVLGEGLVSMLNLGLAAAHVPHLP